MNLTEQFLQLASFGANWVLWLLVFLSVASVAAMLERWFYFRSLAGRDRKLLIPVNDALSSGELEQAKALVKGGTSPGARMVASMLDVADRGRHAAGAIMDGLRTEERLRLEKNLSFLGTVGSNAPFIGLFGTVLEILRVFGLLGEQGVTSGKEAQAIMTGISEALVATAVGLIVAIPAVVAYNAGQRKVKRLLAQADALAYAVLANLEDSQSSKKG
jgi:biopolymer transport protein ExbB